LEDKKLELEKAKIVKTIIAYNRHRLIITTLALAFVIIISCFWITIPLKPLIILMVSSYVIGVISLSLVKIEKGLSTLLYLPRIIDSFLVLGCIYFTGGIESFFTPVFIFIILGAGIVLGLMPSMMLTTMITFSYITIILLEYLGIITHYHILPIIGCVHDSPFYTFCLLGLNASFFYVASFISGYLCKIVQEKTIEVNKSKQREKFAKEFLDSILSNMADGLIVTDVDLKVQMVNLAAQKILGHTEDEMRNKPIVEFIRDETLPILLKKTIKEGELSSEELEIINPIDNKKTVVTLKISSLKDAFGKVVGIIVVSRDVTEEELFERTRANFLSLVTHELRTPLSSIKAYAETLLDGVDNPQEVKEFLQVINSESDTLSRQINQILMFTEMDVKRIPLRKRLINLSQLIVELIDLSKPVKETMLEKMAQEKKIAVSINIPENLPEFWADYRKIKTAIEHLIENAIKFTPAGGKVNVEALKVGDEIKVCVTDTGVGIAKDKLSQVFTPFYQLEEPMTKETKGIGLGLSLVKHIIETHGGKIWVESEEGKGSSFYFTLPIEGSKTIG
jgi:two-component system phosphate regulon sensor histidine kinase PhoR